MWSEPDPVGGTDGKEGEKNQGPRGREGQKEWTKQGKDEYARPVTPLRKKIGC